MKFHQVIVVNPPNPPGFVSNKDSMGGFGHLFPIGATYMPPLDLIYLASYLDREGVPQTVIECLGEELDEEGMLAKLAVALPDPDWPALLVARTSAPTLDWDLSVLQKIKTRFPGISIGVFGAIVTHTLQRIEREAHVDYIIDGEPDETVHELMAGQAEEAVSGLIYRNNGEWVQSPKRVFIKELDRLPFLKWELFPYQNYRLPRSSNRPAVTFLPMLSSRGCPVGCHYCPYPVGQGLLFRLRSPENVVDEIEHLVRDLKVEYILFRDPIFSLNQNRVIAICEEIIRRGIKVEWKCETRIDCLREETLEMMARAGCTGINFGVESAEVEIQANVGRKPITRERFIETIALCHRLGIKTFGFFIIGLPGDTVDTIMSSIRFAIDMKANMVQFTSASPFIGTKLRDWAIGQGLATEHEFAYVNSFTVTMGNENLSKEQVRTLARFAQFTGNYFINRKGILKDDYRPSPLYQAAKRLADWASHYAAVGIYAVGNWYFRSRYTTPAGKSA